MNIHFKMPQTLIDIIGKDLRGIKIDIDDIRIPPVAKGILLSVKNKMIERFSIFKDEILKEEQENKDANVLIDFTNDPLEIIYSGYSKYLKNKMEKSFTKEDLDFIERYGNFF